MATLADWTTNENVFTVQNKNTILDSAVIHDTHIRGISFYCFTGDTSHTSNLEEFRQVYSVSRNKITPIKNNTLRIPCINLYDDSVMYATGLRDTYYDSRRITFTGCRYTAEQFARHNTNMLAILSLANHLTVIKDGKVVDTWD